MCSVLLLCLRALTEVTVSSGLGFLYCKYFNPSKASNSTAMEIVLSKGDGCANCACRFSSGLPKPDTYIVQWSGQPETKNAYGGHVLTDQDEMRNLYWTVHRRCDFLPKCTQIHHKIVFIVLVKGSIWIIFHKKFKFHKFVKRVIKMINFITIINIDTPTWPLPTNTNVHTQNAYDMCYLHTTNISLPTLF